MPPVRKTFEERVPKGLKLSECWNWIGCTDRCGYGQYYNGKTVRQAHREMWERVAGRKIPKGRVIMHTCDNPRCVNPNHLVSGTNLLNVQDAIRKGRHRTAREPEECGRIMRSAKR